MADKDVFYHELLGAMQEGGCPMCRLARKASDSYLNALIYEGVVDVGIREALHDTRGPCHRHAWRIRGAAAVFWASLSSTAMWSIRW